MKAVDYVAKALKDNPITCGKHDRFAIAQCIDCWEDVIAQAIEDEREACAKSVRDHMIYTGPGQVDLEPIQKILADVIRKRGSLER